MRDRASDYESSRVSERRRRERACTRVRKRMAVIEREGEWV